METVNATSKASAIVSAAIDRTVANPDQGQQYLARPAGSSLVWVDSTNGKEVATLLKSLEWHNVTSEARAKRVGLGEGQYFWARLPEGVQGLEGIALVEELDEEQLKNIRVVKGHHGNLELQLEGLEPRPTNEVHIIVGNLSNFPAGEVTPESAGVVTWYPGRLTAASTLEQQVVKRA